LADSIKPLVLTTALRTHGHAAALNMLALDELFINA
jgi:hypothetical protein